jgi:peptide/nickel transport system ATP-binding protein
MPEATPILEARGLHRSFPVVADGGVRGLLRAVRGVDLTLAPGEAVALVGESGCGKSTLARLLLGLTPPTDGRALIGGTDAQRLSRRQIARQVQPVFQDPFVSLNPRKRVEQIVGLPLVAAGGTTRRQRRDIVGKMIELVGLSADFADRRPGDMSGGQRQRVSIARALVAEPSALICDEPTSALDVSVQAQILNLLQDIRARLGLAYLVITHNLAVVDYLAERIVVMYFGRVVESGPTREVLARPLHPYTQMLRRAVLEPVAGQTLPDADDAAVLPNPLLPPAGCPFRSRCARATDICSAEEPALTATGNRQFACHNPLAGDDRPLVVTHIMETGGAIP